MVSMHLLGVIHFPSQPRAATFEVQLSGQQSGSIDILEQSALEGIAIFTSSSKGISNTSVQRPSRKVTFYTVRTFCKAP